MKSRTKKIILIPITIILLGYIASNFIISNTDAKQFLVASIKSHPEIKNHLGDIKEVSIRSLNMNISALSSTADFECEVIGSKSTGVVYLDLVMKLGKWEIISGVLKDELGNEITLRTDT
jgi:hypothetical protein